VSVEQFIAILGALAVLIGAVAGAIAQLRQTHALVNSRMTELLALTRSGAHAEGVLEEKAAARSTVPRKSFVDPPRD